MIKTIRASNDKQDAKERIIKKYDFSDRQAEAIVNLQLYRLTNTDITALEGEASELREQITGYEEILANEKKLLSVIKKDLKLMKKKYADKRQTQIEEKIEELKINLEVMVASEDVLVSVTRDGYLKRTSLRSYGASTDADFTIKDQDHLVALLEINTTENILLFTNKGRYVIVPVHQLPDIKWKDLGQHVSNLASLEKNEKIVKVIPVQEFKKDEYLIFFTANGMVKKSSLEVYSSQRFARPLIAINLKGEDELLNVHLSDGNADIFVATNTGYGLWFHESEVAVIGQRASGVKAIQLKKDEKVVNGLIFDDLIKEQQFILVTQRGACKRMDLSRFEKSSRAKRGLIMLRELKRNTHRVVGFDIVNEEEMIEFSTTKDVLKRFSPVELPKSDRYSNGSFMIDTDQHGEVKEVWKTATYRQPFTNENI